MKLFVKSFILFGLILTTAVSNAQFYFLDDAYQQIEVNFSKNKIETTPNETFFNILKIKNTSDRKVEFLSTMSFPHDWTFMAEKQQRITLSPYDSILIPIRASASIEAKGDIGYAIVASLTDLKGTIIKTEYSFVNIPKVREIGVKPINRIEYIKKNTQTASIKLAAFNNGNTDEIFYFNFFLDDALETQGMEDGIFKEEITLKPYQDTILELPISFIKNKNIDNRSFHKVGIKTSTIDTSFNSTIWLKELEKSYFNPIPDNYKMLSIELGTQNLFRQDNPTFTLNMVGNLLFKNNSNLHMNFQGYGSTLIEDPWKYSQFKFTYSFSKFIISAGDVSESVGQGSFGRGASIKYKDKKNSIIAVGSKSKFIDKYVVGASYNRKTKLGAIGGGYSYGDNNFSKLISKVGFVNYSNGNRYIGSFTLGLLRGDGEWYVNEKKTITGYGGYFGYNKIIKNGKFSVTVKHGQPTFIGSFRGQTHINSLFTYKLNTLSSIDASYYRNNHKPIKYIQDSLVYNSFNNIDIAQASFHKMMNNKVRFSIGPLSEGRTANEFVNFDTLFNFSTRNALINSSLRLKTSRYSSFVFGIKGGATFVTDYPEEIFLTKPNSGIWPNFLLSTTFQSKKWGVYLSYNHGPNSIAQQFSYFASNYFAKHVRIMPYFDIPIIPKYLSWVTRFNYSYDISGETNRLNVTSDLVSKLGDTWEVMFSTTYGYQANVDKVTEEKYTYSSTYFELRIAKDIIGKQPLYQYHNLDVIFFKDFNGNRVKDEDEPGIKNILFNIQKDEQRYNENGDLTSSGYFMPVDLLSDMNGHVFYKNVPNGFYTIEYFPIGAIEGAFSSEQSMENIYIGKKETLYIPFVENNKIFGRALLNRSKLSNLGQIDIGNIKVTAEDSQGRKYSSLTDGNGYFTIYIPSIDRYKVNINNIFFENFELEQNNYQIQLNGYKQFEVNFVFNEKKRKINFTSSYEYGSKLDGPGVEIIRRTNLSGNVKDATTLKPVVANILIKDGEGDKITGSKSNSKTGIFTTSFIAGDNYSLEVFSDEYWYHEESLYSNQIVTFKNLKKEILLKTITVGQIIPMKTLKFEAGTYDIPAISFPELERLMKVLKKNPSVKIAVHGHADDLEILDSDTDLALERAKLVAKYLIANGYNRVKYVGHANTKPVADNDTEDGRRQNRRVEIVVTGK